MVATRGTMMRPDTAVRDAGLSTHPAVATAVGATVITDTAALVVLAAVSGSQLEGGGPVSIGIQIAFGLVVLAVFSLIVLPRLVRYAFRHLGTDRPASRASQPSACAGSSAGMMPSVTDRSWNPAMASSSVANS